MRTQFLIGPRPRADEPRNTLNTRKGIAEEEKIERDRRDWNPDGKRPRASSHLDVILSRSKPGSKCVSNVNQTLHLIAELSPIVNGLRDESQNGDRALPRGDVRRQPPSQSL